MKKYYKAAGIPTARQLKGSEGASVALRFAGEVGYPLIAKPDVGVGAGGTHKIHNQEELGAFFGPKLRHRGVHHRRHLLLRRHCGQQGQSAL